MPAYLALELATTAFADALPHLTDGMLVGEDVVIAHLEASFGRELLIGEVDADFSLRKVGRTSLEVEVTLEQADHPAGPVRFRFVLVHVVDGRAETIPTELRAVLEKLVT